MDEEDRWKRTPRAWSAAVIAGLALGALAVGCLALAAYEYGKWRAPVPEGIPQDFSQNSYLAATLISGFVGLVAILGLYFMARRWRAGPRHRDAERERT